VALRKRDQPPIDYKSDERYNQADSTECLNEDPATSQVLFNAVIKLSDVKADAYDTVFYLHDPEPTWDRLVLLPRDSRRFLQASFQPGADPRAAPEAGQAAVAYQFVRCFYNRATSSTASANALGASRGRL
jgi:hypothetical protein